MNYSNFDIEQAVKPHTPTRTITQSVDNNPQITLQKQDNFNKYKQHFNIAMITSLTGLLASFPIFYKLSVDQCGNIYTVQSILVAVAIVISLAGLLICKYWKNIFKKKCSIITARFQGVYIIVLAFLSIYMLCKVSSDSYCNQVVCASEHAGNYYRAQLMNELTECTTLQLLYDSNKEMIAEMHQSLTQYFKNLCDQLNCRHKRIHFKFLNQVWVFLGLSFCILILSAVALINFYSVQEQQQEIKQPVIIELPVIVQQDTQQQQKSVNVVRKIQSMPSRQPKSPLANIQQKEKNILNTI